MKKAYRTYKKADISEARELLASNNPQKAVIYKDGDHFRLAISVFTNEERGMMRHVIFPETLSEMCQDPKEGQDLFNKICELKKEHNLYYRIGSLENPVYYGRLLPVDSDRTYPSVKGSKFPFFRENETFAEGADINDYIGRSVGFMQTLYGNMGRNAVQYLSHSIKGSTHDMGYSLSPIRILYRLEKNLDGTLPDLSTPVPAPSSQHEADRIESIFGLTPEDGMYTKGFRFTPIFDTSLLNRPTMKALLAGHISEKQAEYRGAVLFSTPYVFNLRSSSGEVRHDIVLDPVQAASLMDASLILPDNSSNTVAKGVFRSCVADYKRLPSPPLKDDVYLFGDRDIDGLYGGPLESESENNVSVSRVFRHPVFNQDSDVLSLSDISKHERVDKGCIRSIYIPHVDLANDAADSPSFGGLSFSPPPGGSFVESNHNHYVSMVVKYGYLKRDQASQEKGEDEAAAEANHFDLDGVPF